MTSAGHAHLGAGVNTDRLWRRHMEMAKIGATEKGGVERQTLTDGENQARLLLVDWAAECGFGCSIDDAGNMFIRREGLEPDAAPVMSGSHMDTQPNGGRFDGIYGILAALEAMQVIDEAGLKSQRPIEAVLWTNEEGSRFTPGCMGSRSFVRPALLDGYLDARDRGGESFGDALATTLQHLCHVERRPLGGPVSAFVEAHIEQGPILEASENTIGIVSGIQGLRWFIIDVVGEAGHAGTVPLSRRRDAAATAIALMARIGTLARDADKDDLLRLMIGQIDVVPNAPSTIPERVRFSVDMRHPDETMLAELAGRITGLCTEAAGACDVHFREASNIKPVAFSSTVMEPMRRAAQDLDFTHMTMISGAMHDASFLAEICPTGMIFVPCEKGISHNEAENAKAKDLAAGAAVLAETLLSLANADE
jgi:beta-ureidopropionase / N-carbamoyl-L-amino-acid hydrolase